MRSLNDRIGNKVLMSRYIVTDNSVVMKEPSCGVGGYGAIRFRRRKPGAVLRCATRNRFYGVGRHRVETGSRTSGSPTSGAMGGGTPTSSGLASVYYDYPTEQEPMGPLSRLLFAAGVSIAAMLQRRRRYRRSSARRCSWAQPAV